jgi:hypothetical protein
MARSKEPPAPERDPVVVHFPLRGEWTAPNTPAKRVPSHGTDMLGQRYAFDFVRTDPARKGMIFYKASLLHYLVAGVRIEECFGWGDPIHSPVAGVVVAAADGWPERERLQPFKDLALVLKTGFTFNPRRLTDFRPLAGNHLIIETDAGFAFPTGVQRSDGRAGRSPRRCRPHGQLHGSAPALSRHGPARRAERPRPPVLLPRIRGLPRRRMGQGREWRPGAHRAYPLHGPDGLSRSVPVDRRVVLRFASRGRSCLSCARVAAGTWTGPRR